MDVFEQFAVVGAEVDSCDDVNASMEGYLAELVELNAATEAFDAKAVGEKIQTFVRKAKERLVQFIGTIVKRLGEMIAALANLVKGTKEVEVPTELADAYRVIDTELTTMSEKSSKYVMDAMDYHMKIQIKASTNRILGATDDSRAINEVNKEWTDNIDRLKESVAKIDKADVLKNGSIEDYAARLREKEPRTAKITPSKEQAKLNGMRSKWNGIHTKVKATGVQLAGSLATANAMLPEEQKRVNQYWQMQYSKVYNIAIQTCVGIIAIISRAQKYVTAFRYFGTKWKTQISEARDNRPTMGELPAPANA